MSPYAGMPSLDGARLHAIVKTRGQRMERRPRDFKLALVETRFRAARSVFFGAPSSIDTSIRRLTVYYVAVLYIGVGSDGFVNGGASGEWERARANFYNNDEYSSISCTPNASAAHL